MQLDEVKQTLLGAGHKITKECRLGNDTGSQLRLENGAIINVFDKGTIQFQGKNKQELEALFNAQAEKEVTTVAQQSNRIFVVYGHDSTARDQLEAMLRRWGLEPVILDQLPSEGATLIEKLENYYKQVGFAVVLATPDDEGHRANHPDEKAYRARQNVVLELGMLLAYLGRKRVAILIRDQDKMEKPSDIQGLIYIPFKTDIAKDAGLLLAKEMTAQGFKIDVAKI